ncbi:phospholipase C [Sciscionella marina]|uniref:phospholipase C n=1 Tax=Sciscionella marina TaxID=508770 RepID=UPI00037313CC|nr:alkaline phosphatase family protein [Sciscionella marina]
MNRRKRTAALISVAAAGCLLATACSGTGGEVNVAKASNDTATPIKHLVVLFDENISFDHYFGTYPNATNADGTPFRPKPGTPKINGLTPELLNHNPNAYQPKRLGPDKAATCDQSHDYDKEQKAFNGGKMDKFVEHTESDTCTGQPALFGEPGLVMDYFDGNTVTAMWNYAQHYALNDNSFNSVFGPSTPGAIDLASGQTHGVYAVDPKTGDKVNPPDDATVASPDKDGVGTLVEDPDPAWDDCSNKNRTSDDQLAAFQGKNIGDRLNERGVSWGWFQGGFRPTGEHDGHQVCAAKHKNIAGQEQLDYVPHHDPFNYYKPTSNPKHLPPESPAEIGKDGQANHNYDLTDFDTALENELPAVSFLKAPQYQNGHAGNSDPIDEQHFLAEQINKIQHSKDWKSTAVVIAYDDSDGWYDHAPSPIVNGSSDAKLDSPMCKAKKQGLGGFADRCGYGPRLPFLVVSPYAKQNFVDHTQTDQTSIIKFVERNWNVAPVGGGSYDARAGSMGNMFDFKAKPNTRPLLLDPETGAVR